MKNPLRARNVKLAGETVSQIAYGTEHINQFLPELLGKYCGMLLCKTMSFFGILIIVMVASQQLQQV